MNEEAVTLFYFQELPNSQGVFLATGTRCHSYTDSVVTNKEIDRVGRGANQCHQSISRHDDANYPRY